MPHIVLGSNGCGTDQGGGRYSMMMIFLVFGTAALFSRFVSRALPKGAWFFILASALTAVFCVIVGFGYGVFLAYMRPGGDHISLPDYLMSGMRNGFLAALSAPVFVWHYRKGPTSPVNTKLSDRYAGLHKPDY